MSDDSLDEKTLKKLIANHAVREFVVCRLSANEWTLSVRLGGPTMPLLTIGSRRKGARIWLSLTALGKFTHRLGVSGFFVEMIPGSNPRQ